MFIQVAVAMLGGILIFSFIKLVIFCLKYIQNIPEQYLSRQIFHVRIALLHLHPKHP